MRIVSFFFSSSSSSSFSFLSYQGYLPLIFVVHWIYVDNQRFLVDELFQRRVHVAKKRNHFRSFESSNSRFSVTGERKKHDDTRLSRPAILSYSQFNRHPRVMTIFFSLALFLPTRARARVYWANKTVNGPIEKSNHRCFLHRSMDVSEHLQQ